MRYILTKLLLVFCAIFLLESCKDNNPRDIKGTYEYKSGKADYATSGLLKIHYKNNNNILFYLELSRNTDLNTGTLYGRLVFDKSDDSYKYVGNDTDAGCTLKFVKEKAKIIVETIKGDCGFGGGVFADGTYLQKAYANPLYFVGPTDTKIYFDRTPPEKVEY